MSKKPTSRSKSEPFPEWEDWSTSKFFQFLRSGLRAKWSRWPPKYAALAAAKREYKGDNKRQKYEYKCAKCRRYHPQKDVSVDHIEPVGSLKSFDDLPSFCQRLFVGVDKLQVLCRKHHLEKSAQENAERKKNNNKEI